MRTKNRKIRKFAQPKMAQALVGDMPSFIPPGKMPFITHMWRQAQNVPMMPQQAFWTAVPKSGLMVNTNKQITRGILAWTWLGNGFRIAGTQTMAAKRHIITDARTASWMATAKFVLSAPMFSILSMAFFSFVATLWSSGFSSSNEAMLLQNVLLIPCTVLRCFINAYSC